MSRRLLIFLSAVITSAVFFISCSPQHNDTVARTFERAFSVDVTVSNAQAEYHAKIIMSALPDAVSGETGEGYLRDGSVQYISPDSISDIYAKRTDSVVVVGVSGIEITPSPEIAEKYVRLLDILDIRSEQMKSVSKVQTDGIACTEAVFSHEGGEVRVIFDADTNMPIKADCGDIKIQFSEFVYL